MLNGQPTNSTWVSGDQIITSRVQYTERGIGPRGDSAYERGGDARRLA